MSIAIQKEITQQVERIVADEAKLSWIEFVDQIAGDNEHLLNYLPVLKSIPAMTCPFELAVQFDTISGQFARSESKMIDLLVEANFVDGQDYCQIEVTNEKLEETLLFLSYNCLKMFIMDRDDTKMIRAVVLGEQMYNQYQSYSKPFTKSLVPKTHYMLIEQKKFESETMQRAVKNMGHPEVIIVMVTGNNAKLVKFLQSIEKDPAMWGDVIIPPTQSIFADALDDTARIVEHVTETLVKPYKYDVRLQCKARKEKAPTCSSDWGCSVKSTSIMLNPNVKALTFTHDDIVACIKAYFISTLARQHVTISKLSHDEYLECVAKWEAVREEKTGYFSAFKANAIYARERLNVQKLAAKELKAAAALEKKSESKVNKVTIESVPNGYETNGSDVETKPKSKPSTKADAKAEAKIDEVDEETPIKIESKPKKSSRGKSKVELIVDDAPPAAEKKAKKPAAADKKKTKKVEKPKPVVEVIPDSSSEDLGDEEELEDSAAEDSDA